LLCNRFCIFLRSYISFQAKEVVQLIHQSSANTARVRHPRAAKTDTNYAERKVRSGDPLESDASKYSPNSELSDEEDKKPKAAKTKSPSQKQPANDIVAGGEGEDEEEEVSIIGL
jgi:hypothetical protein